MSFDVFIRFAVFSPNYISKYKLRNMWRNDQGKLSLLLVTATSTVVTVT